MSTYAVLESSDDESNPFYIYEFTRGATVWRYAATDYDVVKSGETYLKSAISHGVVAQSGNMERIQLDIILPLSHPLAVAQRSPNIGAITTLTIFRGHHDMDDETQYQIFWKGRIVSSKISGVTSTLVCENLQTSMRRYGLRGRYQRMCRHTLYSSQCGLDLADYLTTVTATTVSGSSIVVTSVLGKTDVSGYYGGGILKFGDEYGYITSHVGTSLTLLNPMPNLSSGGSVQIAPGCPLQVNVCDSRFGNSLNFGGFSYIPDRNPFGGNSGQPIA